MPEISVIIPVYKAEDTLQRCVDSVLAQSFTDFEIILVDDGSPDRCGEICGAYAARDSRISVIHKTNGGVSSARNAGLDIARGSRVLFLDSDDSLAPDCMDVLTAHDADLVIGGISILDSEGNISEQLTGKDELLLPSDYPDRFPAMLLGKQLSYLHAKLYRADIITAHGLRFEDYRLTFAEDTVFNFTYLQYCSGIYVCSRALMYYTYNSGGLAHQHKTERYDAAVRTDAFLTDVCRRMDIYTDEMRRALAMRHLGYIDHLTAMIPRYDISRREQEALLNRICSDKALRDIRAAVPDSSFDSLDSLFADGVGGYLSRARRMELARPIKRAGSTAKMYGKELLLRLHIIKRNG